MKRTVLTLITLLLLFNTSSAQIKVILGGVITKDSTLPTVFSPYLVENSLVIAQGATLTIQPGTKIYFRKNASILCYGTLIAKGTQADSIIFTVEDTSKPVGVYNGISIFTNSQKTATQIQLEYCAIECAQTVINGVNGAYTESTGNIALRHCSIRRNDKVIEIPNSTRNSNDSIIISHCNIYDNGSCITQNKLSTIIDNTTLSNNKLAIAGADRIANTILYNNETAIILDADANSQVTNNEILYNDTGIVIRYWFDDTLANPKFFRDNKVCGNRDWNIYNEIPTDATLYHTCFCLTSINDIKKTIRDKQFAPSTGEISIANINSCTPSLPAPTSVNNISGNIMTKLYPNPTYGNTTLEFSHDNAEQYTVIIKTITGKTIYIQRNISNGKVTLPTNNLPAGIYIIQLQDSKLILATEKLAVQ